MPARWSADSVLALAPDDSSRRAAATLARPAPWDGAGAAGDLVWGLCAGSGKNPYQVIVDLASPAFKCSCPSRKFPCKHALALLMLWSGGTVPDATEPADYARTWQQARQEKADRPRSSAGTGAADFPAVDGSPAAPGETAGPASAGRDDSAGRGTLPAGRMRPPPPAAPLNGPGGSPTASPTCGSGSATRSGPAWRPPGRRARERGRPS